MRTYETGSVKYDPISKSVAIKTVYPEIEGFLDRQWGVMTTDRGGCFLSNEQVETWIDVTVPSGPASS